MRILLISICFLFSIQSYAFKDSLAITKEMEEAYLMAYMAHVDSVESTFTYVTDQVDISNGLATLKVPAGFKYLNGQSSEKVLEEIWGNPPSTSLGMLFPRDAKLSDTTSYGINITYSEDGYIDDKDAKKLNYDDLLGEMQRGVVEGNKQRKELGYPTVDLVGWASPPFYDAENKKLHWAKELHFEDDIVNSLNYNIRILGRKGFLEMNVIGAMHDLPVIKENVNGIVSSIEFKDGSKYSDFNPSIDKVAAYGIGGLIAGKMIAKAGLLAKAGILLAKFWKVIAIAFIAFGAGIKRFFGGGGKEEEPESPDVTSERTEEP